MSEITKQDIDEISILSSNLEHASGYLGASNSSSTGHDKAIKAYHEALKNFQVKISELHLIAK